MEDLSAQNLVNYSKFDISQCNWELEELCALICAHYGFNNQNKWIIIIIMIWGGGGSFLNEDTHMKPKKYRKVAMAVTRIALPHVNNVFNVQREVCAQLQALVLGPLTL